MGTEGEDWTVFFGGSVKRRRNVSIIKLVIRLFKVSYR